MFVLITLTKRTVMFTKIQCFYENRKSPKSFEKKRKASKKNENHRKLSKENEKKRKKRKPLHLENYYCTYIFN